MTHWTLASLQELWGTSQSKFRVYQDKVYFEGIIHAHAKLDPIDRSACLLGHYDCPEGYIIVVEKLDGINLETLPPEMANNLIEEFYRELEPLGPTDRDASPSKYVQDSITGRIRCIDLSELWFADSPF